MVARSCRDCPCRSFLPEAGVFSGLGELVFPGSCSAPGSSKGVSGSVRFLSIAAATVCRARACHLPEGWPRAPRAPRTCARLLLPAEERARQQPPGLSPGARILLYGLYSGFSSAIPLSHQRHPADASSDAKEDGGGTSNVPEQKEKHQGGSS